MDDNKLIFSATEKVNIDGLIGRRNVLISLVDDCEKFMKNAPEGTLHIVKRKRKTEYYNRFDVHQTNGRFIRRNEKKLLSDLAQKKYVDSIVSEAKREIRLIDDFVNGYDSRTIFEVQSKMDESIRNIITPVVVTDEEFARRWSEVTYAPASFDEGAPEHYTDKNERVRSKSEIMIANALNMNNVPYRYEYPLKLKDGRVVRPDFLCLNVRTREEFYWEHLGMMSDLEYVANSVRKINAYASEDIVQGKNLLLTYETQFQPLDTRVVKKMIWEFLK